MTIISQTLHQAFYGRRHHLITNLLDGRKKIRKAEPLRDDSIDSLSSSDTSDFSSASTRAASPTFTSILPGILGDGLGKLEYPIPEWPGQLRPKPRTIEYDEALLTVGWQMDNPYIWTGYRQASGSIRQCMYSIYGYLHNETFNILTHLLGSMLFCLILLSHLISESWIFTAFVPWSAKSEFAGAQTISMIKSYDHQSTLSSTSSSMSMSIYLVSCVICLGMSAAFHTLNCHSAKVSHRAHRCDYVGIVVLAVGSIIPIVHYAFISQPFWLAVYTCGIGIMGTFTATIVLHPHYRSRLLLRTSTFLVLGSSVIVPVLHVTLQEGYSQACRKLAVGWTIAAGILYVSGTLI
nr:uncharacterized protein I303_00908 [Kwoniella dejecticola CBS 10117]OBR89086.1 hypothetical protein I303_00908 [Kwoniella dejecticola CBS 10117]